MSGRRRAALVNDLLSRLETFVETSSHVMKLLAREGYVRRNLCQLQLASPATGGVQAATRTSTPQTSVIVPIAMHCADIVSLALTNVTSRLSLPRSLRSRVDRVSQDALVRRAILFAAKGDVSGALAVASQLSLTREAAAEEGSPATSHKATAVAVNSDIDCCVIRIKLAWAVHRQQQQQQPQATTSGLEQTARRLQIREAIAALKRHITRHEGDREYRQKARSLLLMFGRECEEFDPAMAAWLSATA